MVSALQLITGQRSFAGYKTQSSVGELASARWSSSSDTTISAAGTALTAEAEDDAGSERPTSGRLPMCGARDGPEVGDEIGVCNMIEGSLPLDLALGGKGVLWPEITGLGAGGVGVGQPSILGLGTGGTATPSTPLGISKERGAGDLLRLLSAGTSDGSTKLSKAKMVSAVAASKVAAMDSISKPGRSGSRLFQTNRCDCRQSLCDRFPKRYQHARAVFWQPMERDVKSFADVLQ